jgi:hypothetical protein
MKTGRNRVVPNGIVSKRLKASSQTGLCSTEKAKLSANPPKPQIIRITDSQASGNVGFNVAFDRNYSVVPFPQFANVVALRDLFCRQFRDFGIVNLIIDKIDVQGVARAVHCAAPMLVT